MSGMMIVASVGHHVTVITHGEAVGGRVIKDNSISIS
jgi:hypothetical protein